MMAWVARQPAPAATSSMMARVDRLDVVLSYLQEMHHHHHPHHRRSNSVTSSPSTTPAGTGDSSAASTPRGNSSWRRASCRPAKEVLEETQAKGSLVDRIAFLEDRLLKMEEDMEITPEKSVTDESLRRHHHGSSKKKKGLKSLVKSCVIGKLKTKD